MIEAGALEELGERLTDSYIIRQKEEPYCVELHPKKLASFGLNIAMNISPASLYVQKTLPLQFSEASSKRNSYFTQHELNLIDKVMKRYGHLSDKELKRAVYCTGIMRATLRKERLLGLNFFNTPLLVPKFYEELR